MQFTIEARELTSESTPQPLSGSRIRASTIEALDEGEAVSNFVRENDSELVSFHPLPGRESIATVKKADAVFLIRVYPG